MSRIKSAHAAAAAAALIAGAAVVATRFVVGETDALSLVFYRYLIAVVCFAPFLWKWWPRTGLSPVECLKIAVLGVLFFGMFPWAFNAALLHNPAARVAVGLATIPVLTLLLSAAFRREALSPAKVAGVLLAFVGVAVAFGRSASLGGDSRSLAGDGLMMLSAFCAAVYSVFSRPTLMRHGPLFVTALAMVCAIAVLLPLVRYSGGGQMLPVFSVKGWIAVVFLGTIAGAVQFSLYMWALRWLPPTTAALYLTLNPITAVVLGVALLGEHLTVDLLAGMGLVLFAILIANGVLPLGANPRRSA